jgi:hypothetical protein
VERRRWAGILLLVIAMVGSVLVDVLIRMYLVAGIPARIAIEGPPAIGHCVEAVRPRDESTLSTNGIAVPSARMSSCTEPHIGEVVSVTLDGRLFPIVSSGGFIHYQTSYCSAAAGAFVGLIEDSALDAPWTRVGQGVSGVIGPTSRQRRVGQNWVACISFAPSGSYIGTTRNSLADRARPGGFTLCRSTASTDAPTISCNQPHGLESFASTFTFRPDDRHLGQSCRALVARITGTVDPTWNGRLSITVRRSPNGAAADRDGATIGDQPSDATVVDCAVTVREGVAMIAGSLVGIRNTRLPWA